MVYLSKKCVSFLLVNLSFLASFAVAGCFAAEPTKVKATDSSSPQIPVLLESFDWSGNIPASRQVIVRNPYGSISSRNHGEKKVILHATMQKIGQHKLVPKFDIQEHNGQLVIDVVYPETIFDDDGAFKARTDIAILFPNYVNIYAQTDFGMIKIDKTASSVSAFSHSGSIKLATTGLFYAESVEGKIELKLRGLKMKGRATAKTKSGNIDIELFNDMDLQINARSQALVIKDGKQIKNKILQLTQGNGISNVEIMSEQGIVDINVVPPPALVKSVRPSEKKVDLRQLPIAKLWSPGDVVIERNDRRDNRYDK